MSNSSESLTKYYQVLARYREMANPNCEYCVGSGVASIYDMNTILPCKCTSDYEEQETDAGSRSIV